MIALVVGARPQFIKAAAIVHALADKHPYTLIHTGQHYDENLSEVFFRELEMPQPDVNLGVGSGTHGEQTGAMMVGIERVLLHKQPNQVLVFGDTNSTLAGALAAAKLNLPLAHLEAGLRSYNRKMPEEINRIVADRLSNILFCPSSAARDNLSKEGIQQGVYVVGDVMADILFQSLNRAFEKSNVMERLKLSDDHYYLATVHRVENSTEPSRLSAILAAFRQMDFEVVLPAHPRTRVMLLEHGLLEGGELDKDRGRLRMIEPLGYLDMIRLAASARAILTDSGGLQKEAYWLGKPCITLRDETEWVETVAAGWNVLAGADTERILQAAMTLRLPTERKPLYGDGRAAERCVAILTGNSIPDIESTIQPVKGI